MAKIVFPSQMNKLTLGESEIELSANSLGMAFEQMARQFPALGEALMDDHGNVAPFIKVFVGDVQVAQDEFSTLVLGNDDTVTIIAAVAGG